MVSWSSLSRSLLFCCFSCFIRVFLGQKWRLAEWELLPCAFNQLFSGWIWGRVNFPQNQHLSITWFSFGVCRCDHLIWFWGSSTAYKRQSLSFESSQSCKKSSPAPFPQQQELLSVFVKAKLGVSLKWAEKSPPYPVTPLLFQVFIVCLCYSLQLNLEFKKNSRLRPNFQKQVGKKIKPKWAAVHNTHVQRRTKFTK